MEEKKKQDFLNKEQENAKKKAELDKKSDEDLRKKAQALAEKEKQRLDVPHDS